jgi:hypothetical protein
VLVGGCLVKLVELPNRGRGHTGRTWAGTQLSTRSGGSVWARSAHIEATTRGDAHHSTPPHPGPPCPRARRRPRRPTASVSSGPAWPRPCAPGGWPCACAASARPENPQTLRSP